MWPVWLGLLASACTCAAEPEPQAPTAWMPPASAEAVPIVDAQGQVMARLRFSGVGSMYRTWFGSPDLVLPLVEALAPCVSGPPEILVTYDEGTRQGRVVLLLARSQLRCEARQEDDHLDLEPLSALGGPLAAYRNQLAGLRDIRIYGFDTGLHVEDGTGAVTLWLEGQHPIDGSSWSPCLLVDGTEHCSGPDQSDGDQSDGDQSDGDQRRESDGVSRVRLPGRPGRRVQALLAGD